MIKGTTRYFDDPERPRMATEAAAGLKCDTSGPVPIILVPQPSVDPNDPLVYPDRLRFISTPLMRYRTGRCGSET